MDLCSDDHEEICYETRKCPLCEMREDFQTQIKNLENLSEDISGDLDNIIKENEELKLIINEVQIHYPEFLV